MKDYNQSPALSVVLSSNDVQDILIGRMKSAAMKMATHLFEEEVTRLCGPSFSHKGSHQFHRAGSDRGSIVLQGAKYPVKKPRMRDHKENAEVGLSTYAAISHQDLLDEKMLKNMIEGVSSRRYENVIEDYADRFSVSKSSVSRAFVRSSAKDLDQINGSDLSKEHFIALMMDGIEFAGYAVVCALGITEDGRKVVCGLREGSTENAALCTDLLQAIIERGFSPYCEKLLVVLDGSKALRKAVKSVFGDRAIIQRCYLHKLRNICDYLPDIHHPEARRRMRQMMAATSHDVAIGELKKFVAWLSDVCADAAHSLEEAGEDILTLHKLSVSGNLRKSLASTNLIESLFSVIRDRSHRVKNWKSSPTIRLRWIASAATTHKKRMRKVRGYREIGGLVRELNRIDQQSKVA